MLRFLLGSDLSSFNRSVLPSGIVPLCCLFPAALFNIKCTPEITAYHFNTDHGRMTPQSLAALDNFVSPEHLEKRHITRLLMRLLIQRRGEDPPIKSFLSGSCYEATGSWFEKLNKSSLHVNTAMSPLDSGHRYKPTPVLVTVLSALAKRYQQQLTKLLWSTHSIHSFQSTPCRLYTT